MKTGLYRNRLGVELDVQRQIIGVHKYRTLGNVYEGVIDGGLFGPDLYIVTADGLEAAGYELIEERTDA